MSNAIPKGFEFHTEESSPSIPDGFEVYHEPKSSSPSIPAGFEAYEEKDSFSDDLIDSAQSGFYSGVADIATGTRQLLTNDKEEWGAELTWRDRAQKNLDEIDPERRANMEKWGFGENDDINLENTAMQIGNVAGNLIPSMVPGGAAGKALQITAKTAGMSSKAQKVAQATGYGAGGAAIIGGSSANEVGQIIDGMSDEELQSMPEYLEVLGKTNIPELARNEFKYQQEQIAAKQGAGLGGASMAIAGPILQRIAMGSGSQTALKRIGSGAAVEGAQEGFEEGGQGVIANINTGKPALDGVGERALEGSVLGTGAGGTVGTVGAGINALTGDSDIQRNPDDTPINDEQGNIIGYRNSQTGETYSPINVDNEGLPTDAPQARTSDEATGTLDRALLKAGVDAQQPPVDSQPVNQEQSNIPANSQIVPDGQNHPLESAVSQQSMAAEVPLIQTNDQQRKAQELDSRRNWQPEDNLQKTQSVLRRSSDWTENDLGEFVKKDGSKISLPSGDTSTQTVNAPAGTPVTFQTGSGKTVQGKVIDTNLKGNYRLKMPSGIIVTKKPDDVSVIASDSFNVGKRVSFSTSKGESREGTITEIVNNKLAKMKLDHNGKTIRKQISQLVPAQSSIESAANKAALSPNNDLPEPSQAQKEAGNYTKGHAKVQGMDVSIENPKGSERKGTDNSGKEWSVKMNDHYGYFKSTIGFDKDHLDVFLGPSAEQADKVHVVDQVHPKTGKFDEHKVMMGYESEQQAKNAYLSNYEKNWKGLSNITEMPMEEFKQWAYSDAPKKGALKTEQPDNKTNEEQPKQETETKKESDIKKTVKSETAQETDTKETKKPKINQEFGEKIGGARRDTAIKTGKKTTTKPKDDRPAWQRRYETHQIVAKTARIRKSENLGKWVVFDKRKERSLRTYFDTQEEAEKSIPLAEVGRNHSVRSYKNENDEIVYRIDRDVTDRKRVILKDGFKSRDEAMEYMAKHAVELIETKTRLDASIHPALKQAIRKGEEKRKGDRNVTTDDFQEVFGFRGGEFGNWINSAEGQHILNQAYDALLDMADMLKVPPKALSLNGELAIAFGARGHGLTGASAHYEMNYAAINLTKIKGAGSLAHEWLHAFDHYLGRQANKASSEKIENKRGDKVFKTSKQPESDFVSHGFGYRYEGNTRAELKDAFDKVMDAIQWREMEYTEDTSLREKIESGNSKKLSDKLQAFRADMARDYTKESYKYFRGKKNHEPASPVVLKQIDQLIKSIENGNYGDNIELPTQSRSAWSVAPSVPAKVAKLAELYKKLRGRQAYRKDNQGRWDGQIIKIHHAIRAVEYAKEFAKEAKQQKIKTRKVKSNYYSEAWAIDQGSVKDYWSTAHELAARSFESYIYDKLKDIEARNDFLAYEKHNDLPEYKMFKVKPYPEGKERGKMNETWDDLFSTIKTKETDQGTALYSKRNRLPKGRIWGSTKEIAQAYDKVIAKDYEQKDGVVFEHAKNALIKKVNNKLGGNFFGYSHSIPLEKIRHTVQSHGNKVKEKARGQIAVTKEDFLRVPDIINHADDIEIGFDAKDGEPRIIFIKKMKDGTTVLVEETLLDKKEFAFKSMRKYPQATNIDSIKKNLGLNVRNELGYKLSINESPENVNSEQTKQALEKTLRKLLGRIKNITVVQSQNELPSHLNQPGIIQGVYNNGTVHLVADNIAKGEEKAILLHEVGIHAGLSKEAWFDDILSQVKKYKDKGRIKLAYDAAREANTPDNKLDHEALAYLVENNPKLPVVRRFIAKLKAWLVKHYGVGIKRLTENDFHYLASLALAEQLNSNQIKKNAPGTQYRVKDGNTAELEEQDVEMSEALELFGPAYAAGLDKSNPAVKAEAERLWEEQGTGSPFFQQWFGDSKIRTKQGKPVVVHHGTGFKGLEKFEKVAQGKSGHSSSGLGFFFAPDRGLSATYADGGKVIDAYLKMEQPFVIQNEKLPDFDTLKDAEVYSDELKQKGYDGLIVKNGQQVYSMVVFDSSQVKAIDNKGAFDAQNDNIYYRKPTSNKTKNAVRNSLADKFQSDFLDKATSTVKRHAWGALTLRQIAEVMGKHMPIFKDEYIDRFKQFETDQNIFKEEAGNIAMARQKLPKGMNEKLAALQHQATIEDIDPSKSFNGTLEQKKTYQKLRNQYIALSDAAKKVFEEERDFHIKMHKIKIEALVSRIANIEASEGFKKKMVEKLQLEFEDSVKNGYYAPLARHGQFWVATSDSFDMFESEAAQQRFLKQMREQGVDITGYGKKLENLQEVDGVSGKFLTDIDALIGKIDDQTLVDELRDNVYQLYLESLPSLSSRKHALHRKNTKGFSKDQARAFADKALHEANNIARLRHLHIMEQHIKDAELVLDIASSKTLQKRFREHIDYLSGALNFNGDVAGVIDSINRDKGTQQFRVNTDFESQNEMRADIQRVIQKKKHLLKQAEKIGDKVNLVSDGLSELRLSHQALANPNTHPIAQMMNSLGFTWFLGATPAAALVNITQTPTVALPMMIADKRLKGSATQLVKAAKQFMTGKFSIESNLNKMEQQAFDEWHQSGLLENTLAHDLAGVADSGIDTGSFRHKFQKAVSFMFHHAERMNREVTAIASYRAARATGTAHNMAVKIASDITWKSHFDYAAGNRARFMRGNTARVITQFKQYSQNISYLYGKTIIDAFKASTQEEKAHARKLLYGMMTAQFAVAGTLGLPLASIIIGTLQGLDDAFGDDDDPRDVKAEYRQFLSNNFGNTWGQVLSHGFVDTFTPLSVSGRLSLSDLWVRTSDRELEGRQAALDYINALGGPMVGIFTNSFVAADMMADGNVQRGMKYALPKAIKDVFKSARYANEGAQSLKGTPVKDMEPTEIIAQMLGFSSSELSEIYEQSTAIKNVERKRQNRRQQLITAALDGEDIWDEIREWNLKNPGSRINYKTIRQARKSRDRYRIQTVQGVRQTKANRDLVERYSFAR